MKQRLPIKNYKFTVLSNVKVSIKEFDGKMNLMNIIIKGDIGYYRLDRKYNDLIVDYIELKKKKSSDKNFNWYIPKGFKLIENYIFVLTKLPMPDPHENPQPEFHPHIPQ